MNQGDYWCPGLLKVECCDYTQQCPSKYPSNGNEPHNIQWDLHDMDTPQNKKVSWL